MGVPRGAQLIARRSHAAEPGPLQADAGPDALGDRGGVHGRGVLDGREQKRGTDAQADRARTDAPAPADLLGADHRDRRDGRAGLQRQAPDAAPGRAERAGAHAGALGEDHDAVSAREDRAGRVHRLLIAGAADRPGRRRGR